MKLNDLLNLVNDQSFDTVSVYDTTESDWYHTLFEGVASECPDDLKDREAISIYAATVAGDYGICICLDGNKED